MIMASSCCLKTGGQWNKYDSVYINNMCEVYLLFVLFLLNLVIINILYFHGNECTKYWYTYETHVSVSRIKLYTLV